MKDELAIDVYACCLVTNLVHLRILPRQEASYGSKLVRVLAARQTRHVNELGRGLERFGKDGSRQAYLIQMAICSLATVT